VNDPAPPFDQIAPLISSGTVSAPSTSTMAAMECWNTIKGDDLYSKGLNMIMIFGKQSEGSHEG
jgi:hypothetical protein